MSNLVPISDIEKMALAVAKSGLFGVKNQEQAFALMCVAQAEGLHPAIAARDYHVINGRPTLRSDAMLARFQSAGGKVKWLTLTNEKGVAEFSHPQGGTVEIEWTIAMANAAGLLKNPTWKAYPRAMLRSRVISEGIRTVFPGVVAGYYTPEEIEDSPPPAEPRDVTPPAAPAAEKPARKKRMDAVVESQPEVTDVEFTDVTYTEPEPYDVGTDLTAMRECETVEALQTVFGAAWKAAPEDARAELKAAYDKRKDELTGGEDSPV